MGTKVNVDGRLGEGGDRLISPLDQGFLFGASVYETLRTYEGRPFLLERHLARLRESAEALAIDVPVSDEQMAARLEETLAAASNPESVVRIIVSAGIGSIDYTKGAAPEPMVVILVRPLTPPPPEAYQQGIRVALVDVVRNHPGTVSPRIKASNLLNNLLAMREAQRAGAAEGLMLNYRGEIAEGSMTNVFVVTDGVLRTPPLSAGILEGITRELTLQVAKEEGVELREEPILPEDLAAADEIFITSSAKELLPVTSVGDRKVGDGRPGPVTNGLLAAYRSKVHELMGSPRKGKGDPS